MSLASSLEAGDHRHCSDVVVTAARVVGGATGRFDSGDVARFGIEESPGMPW
jgi:hypothetical protein